jgi:membrane protein involved in colicin uptake
MNAKIDSFCGELRTKLDAVEKRIKGLKADARTATEKAKIEAKTQLAALERRANEQRTKVQAAEETAKTWLAEKKAATADKIATWKGERDVKKLAAHADAAEDYAVACVQLAASAVDEAERAAVEAVAARMDADTAQTAPAKTA